MSSGSENRKATRLVPVRFTPEGFTYVKAAAARAGFGSLGEYLRVRALGPGQGRSAARLAQLDRTELVRTLAEMGRVGSNVNQIARALNSGADPPELVILREIQADLAATFAAVRKALGR